MDKVNWYSLAIDLGCAASAVASLCLIAGTAIAGPVPILDQQEIKLAVKALVSQGTMNHQEIESLLKEFDEMRRTSDSVAAAFVVREAIPERVDRLYRTPEVKLLPKSLRENGLIFAGLGGSTLLSFEKPSDVIAKIGFWFPVELADSRAKNRLWGGDIHLWGPYENWQTEAAAFLAMWNCTPQIAWLQPEGSPFRNVRKVGNPLMPIDAGSSYAESDFGYCVRERNGYQPEDTIQASVERKARVHKIADRVVPHLLEKFSRFLESNRCRGTGPDDCVLVLSMWASLTPGDPKLAAMAQSLEADVAPDSTLPPMAKPFDQSNPDFEAGAQRFDEIWRRVAFLRAKIISILGNSAAWPDDALQRSIRQIIALQRPLHDAYANNYYYDDIDYRTPASSPWRVLYSELRSPEPGLTGAVPVDLRSWVERPRDAATIERVRSVVIAELTKVDGKSSCHVYEPWLTPEVRAGITVNDLQRPGGRLGECVHPDWNWLAAGATPEAAEMRRRFLGFVETASAATRDALLSKLTHDGNDCFGEDGKGAPDWLRRLCSTWIHEPLTVHLALDHTGLTLDQRHQFRKLQSQAPEKEHVPDQRAWARSLAEGMPEAAKTRLAAFTKNLNDHGQWINSAVSWRHPGHSRALIEFGLVGGDCTRLFLLLSPGDLRRVAIPERIWHRSLCHSEIVRVSDLDRDGNLEVWWALSEWGAAAFDECMDDDSDLNRNLDCSAKSRAAAKMGEIADNTLTYFVNNRDAKRQVPAGENWTSTGNEYRLSRVKHQESLPCNRVLIGSVLGPKLNIENWRANADGREVIALTCVKHPVNANQTLVALFHEPVDSEAGGDDHPVGFAVAVIDIKRRKVVRSYRSSIEQDASTRVDSGSLHLDTARYKLTPKVRAFGVRMNIGYSPRYAEGGSDNFLTLFVEEGQKLRPVLSNIEMSSWTMTDSRGCFANEENPQQPCVIERTEKHIALADTSTNGWRDLDLITTVTLDGSSKIIDRQVRRLQYKNNTYQ